MEDSRKYYQTLKLVLYIRKENIEGESHFLFIMLKLEKKQVQKGQVFLQFLNITFVEVLPHDGLHFSGICDQD